MFRVAHPQPVSVCRRKSTHLARRRRVPLINLRPSSLTRTLHCTASISLVESLTASGIISDDDEVQVWTAEGSVAHMVREACLTIGLDPSNFVGQTIACSGHNITVTEEMAEALYPGIDWIREHASDLHVEETLDLGRYVPGQTGTADTWWIWETVMNERWLVLSDLKFGMKGVEAKGCEQQMGYGLALMDKLGWPENIDGLLINIDQPRAFSPREGLSGEFMDTGEDDPGRGMKFWKCSIDELRAFGELLRTTYNDITIGRTFFKPSDSACAYCPARAARPEKAYLGCAAHNQHMKADLEIVTCERVNGDLSLPGPEEFDTGYRYRLVQRRTKIVKWLKDLEEASLAAALDGQPDPGSKVVMVSGGGRIYRNEKRAEVILRSALGEGAFKPKTLIGITEAQKQLKPGRAKKGHPRQWAILERILEKPPGKPALAPITDDRSGVNMSVFDLDELED